MTRPVDSSFIAADPRKPLGPSLIRARQLVAAQIQVSLSGQVGKIPDAMQYATQGGKALRGFLVLETARIHRISDAIATPAAAAIECLHAYSLVHDDLPCMDDDDLRRGRATVHRQWDEATAVLAGDALQSLAFELVAQMQIRPENIVSLVLSLAQAAGVRGMVGGQALDIAAQTAPAPLTLDDITQMQNAKTGALIEWSAMAGPRIAGDDPAAMQRYAQALGLAFQIADDILDVEGDVTKAGKRLQKDAQAGKATFVSHLGLDRAKARASELVTEACDALSCYGGDADTLREAARFVISREN